MKKIRTITLLLLSAVLLCGCVKQSTTVTINNNASAIVEKKLNTASASSLDSSGVIATIEQRFIESVKKQNPVSILRYKDGEDGGIVGVIKYKNIVKEDIFASEAFFTPNGKKNISCVTRGSETECTVDMNIEIAGADLDKFLEEQGLQYKDLDPFVLTINLPAPAKSHNATLFDNEQCSYIWEVPAGQKVPVNVKFSLKK